MSKDSKHQLLDAMSMATTLGLSMVAALAVGLFGGRWLDEYLGTTPWATVFGIIFGMFAGLWSVYKRILHKG